MSSFEEKSPKFKSVMLKQNLGKDDYIKQLKKRNTDCSTRELFELLLLNLFHSALSYLYPIGSKSPTIFARKCRKV